MGLKQYKKILEWMLVGETGMSSEAMAAKMARIESGIHRQLCFKE